MLEKKTDADLESHPVQRAEWMFSFNGFLAKIEVYLGNGSSAVGAFSICSADELPRRTISGHGLQFSAWVLCANDVHCWIDVVATFQEFGKDVQICSFKLQTLTNLQLMQIWMRMLQVRNWEDMGRNLTMCEDNFDGPLCHCRDWRTRQKSFLLMEDRPSMNN